MDFDPGGWLNQLYSTPAGTPGGVPAVDAYGKNVAAAAAQGALGMGTAGLNMTNSYLNDYQPYDKKFMGYVDSIGTDAYRAQQRGQAMTGVQQQSDMARMAQNRDMARMGVNPNSARFAGVNGALAQQTALNKVMAAMATDRSSRDEWVKGLGAINAMGLKVGELGTKNMAVAGDLAKVGMLGADMGAAAADRQTQAGAAATGAGAAAMNAGTNAANAANNYQLGLGRLALDRYNIDTGNAYKTSQNSFGNTASNALIGAGAAWLQNGGFNAIANFMKNQNTGTFVTDSSAHAGDGVYYNNDPYVYGY